MYISKDCDCWISDEHDTSSHLVELSQEITALKKTDNYKYNIQVRRLILEAGTVCECHVVCPQLMCPQFVNMCQFFIVKMNSCLNMNQSSRIREKKCGFAFQSGWDKKQ